MKWVVGLVGIFIILSLVNPILAQEHYQTYNNPNKGFAIAPGIQVYQNYNKPWNSSPYAGEERFQQYNPNSWGPTDVTPRQR